MKKKVLLLEDEIKLPAEEEVIPAGHVKTVDGQIIPRDKCLFIMPEVGTVKDPRGKDLSVFKSHDNVTLYAKRPNGSMLRINGKPKLSKAEKKAAKRAKFK